MTLEKSLADKVLFSISNNNTDNVEKYFEEYSKYVNVFKKKTFDQETWSKVVAARNEYILTHREDYF